MKPRLLDSLAELSNFLGETDALENQVVTALDFSATLLFS